MDGWEPHGVDQRALASLTIGETEAGRGKQEKPPIPS